jgi:hypothetical protein
MSSFMGTQGSHIIEFFVIANLARLNYSCVECCFQFLQQQGKVEDATVVSIKGQGFTASRDWAFSALGKDAICCCAKTTNTPFQ